MIASEHCLSTFSNGTNQLIDIVTHECLERSKFTSDRVPDPTMKTFLMSGINKRLDVTESNTFDD